MSSKSSLVQRTAALPVFSWGLGLQQKGNCRKMTLFWSQPKCCGALLIQLIFINSWNPKVEVVSEERDLVFFQQNAWSWFTVLLPFVFPRLFGESPAIICCFLQKSQLFNPIQPHLLQRLTTEVFPHDHSRPPYEVPSSLVDWLFQHWLSPPTNNGPVTRVRVLQRYAELLHLSHPSHPDHLLPPPENAPPPQKKGANNEQLHVPYKNWGKKNRKKQLAKSKKHHYVWEFVEQAKKLFQGIVFFMKSLWFQYEMYYDQIYASINFI